MPVCGARSLLLVLLVTLIFSGATLFQMTWKIDHWDRTELLPQKKNWEVVEENSLATSDLGLTINFTLLQKINLNNEVCSTDQNKESSTTFIRGSSLLQAKLLEYANYHRDQLKMIENRSKTWATTNTLTWVCFNKEDCKGIGDQLNQIQLSLLLAILSNRVFGIFWDNVSLKTMRYLQPHKVEWDKAGAGTIRSGEPVTMKLLHLNTRQFQNHLFRKSNMLLTYDVPVPLLRGMKIIMSNYKWYENLGISRNVSGQFQTVISADILHSVLLQYLFKFQPYLIKAIDIVQSHLGLSKPYFSLHLRTGFAGNEFEEKKKNGKPFNSFKLIRDQDAWRHALDCATRLANSFLGKNSVIYLATDSYLVKKIATERYPSRIITLDIKLSHTALEGNTSSVIINEQVRTDHKLGHSLDGTFLDDYNALPWLEFVLLARSQSMLRGLSGFSAMASYYCPISASRVKLLNKCRKVKPYLL